MMTVINRQSLAGEIIPSSIFFGGNTDKPEPTLVETEASRDCSELHVDDLLPPGGLLCPDMMQHAAFPLHGPKNTQKSISTAKALTSTCNRFFLRPLKQKLVTFSTTYEVEDELEFGILV